MHDITTGNGHYGNTRLSRAAGLSQRCRLTILAGLLTLPLIAWVCFLVCRDSRRPVYHGKPLALWLQTYTSSARGSREWNEADEAVRHIGTNAIPVLLHLIHAKDSTLKLRLAALAKKQRLIKIHFVPAAARNVQASRAFIVLGDSAKGAVPALVRMYDENVTDESRSAIEDALAWIGPASKPAISLLMRGATNATPRVRADAYWALGDIHAEPELCVPFLMQGLNDSYYWARLSAAHALGMFGTNAQPAIPALTELAKLPLPTQANRFELLQVRLEARNALRKIGAPADAPPQEPFPSFGVPTLNEPITDRANWERYLREHFQKSAP
jgi:hypothetical protein